MDEKFVESQGHFGKITPMELKVIFQRLEMNFRRLSKEFYILIIPEVNGLMPVLPPVGGWRLLYKSDVGVIVRNLELTTYNKISSLGVAHIPLNTLTPKI